MPQYKICKNCGSLTLYSPKIEIKGGTEYITVKCENCGHTETITRSNIHYGNDALNK
jgi:RNase P subunit RPR2